MAENDIYNSKKQWETIVSKISSGAYLKPNKRLRYYIKNRNNVRYFKEVAKKFDYMDISYIRRIQFMKAFREVCYIYTKDLIDITRLDVEDIMRKIHLTHKTSVTRRAFVDYNKQIWKMLFPEKDGKGRPDDTIVPYPWRIKVRSDPSSKKDKPDKITIEEYDQIMRRLSNDPRLQLFFSMLYTNLARPQEICFINLDDIELFDNYARIRISKHGKEGPKTLQLVDNYYYLAEWLNKHPFWKQRDHKNIPLFITMGNNSRNERLSPKHTSKVLRRVLKELGISKPITNYSFKRNGVTHKYISGEPAQNIQKIAGWVSTDQLRIYDISTQEEFLEQELIRKGILDAQDKEKRRFVQYKVCVFCNEINPISNDVCANCKRPLDRERILKEHEAREEELAEMKKQLEVWKNNIRKELMEEALQVLKRDVVQK